MSLTNKVFNIITATFRIKITFEVTDNPDDNSKHKGAIKPVNIFYCFFKATHEISDDDEEYVKKKGKCIRNVTINTDKSIRQFNDYFIDNVKLFVLAEPADAWQKHYSKCIKTVDLKAGSNVNVTISLPAKMLH